MNQENSVSEPKPFPRGYKSLLLDEAFVRLDTPVPGDLKERIIQIKEVRNRYKK
jgi:ABC-type nitrate/sulfonate/bicarbonate transport system ATPase subunit